MEKTILETLNNKKEKIEEIEKKLLIANTKRSGFVTQWREEQKKLKALGIEDPKDEETILNFIKEKEKAIEIEMAALEKLMPQNLIDEYSSIDIEDLENNRELEDINLSQEF